MEFQTNLKKLRPEEGLTQDQLALLVETSTDTIGRIERKQKITSMAYALQYMDAYDYRMHIGHLKKEMNNVILIYGLCDMVHRAMTLVKYFTPNFGEEYYDVLYGCYCRSRKATDVGK